MLRIKSKVISLVTAFGLMAPVAMAADIIKGSEDLPLMKGLTVDEDSIITLSHSDVYYFYAETFGSLKLSQVNKYYGEVLKQFGWKITPTKSDKKVRYMREGRVLTMKSTPRGDNLVVTFEMKSKSPLAKSPKQQTHNKKHKG